MKRIKLRHITIGFVTTGVILLALYIMIHHLGLVESLDFGAGAYYYADIPGFSKLINGAGYRNTTPMWLLIVLFLIWGRIMYKVWTKLEAKL